MPLSNPQLVSESNWRRSRWLFRRWTRHDRQEF